MDGGVLNMLVTPYTREPRDFNEHTGSSLHTDSREVAPVQTNGQLVGYV